MLIRHLLGTVVLEARLDASGEDGRPVLVVQDEDSPLELDRVEAILYELVAVSPDELLQLGEAGYYLQLYRPRPRPRLPVATLECA